MDVTACCGTFGDKAWVQLAMTRAIPSANRLGVPVVHCHAGTLHEARNGALEQVTSEWLFFVDADDEVEHGFLTQMATGSADVRAPAVRYVRGGRAQLPGMPRVAGHTHACTAACLTQGNWLVIGALVRTELVRAVGGFRDFEWSEDWDLWLRCHLAGASFEAIPSAIYRAHVRPDSRNRSASRATRLAAHHAIAAANGIG